MSTTGANVSDLPPPTSGLFLEISFRRLLKSCAEIMAGDNKGREDLTAWQRSPVFHHYVETLQEQLADLTATVGSKRVSEELLQAYERHVDGIADQLLPPDVPAFCLPPQRGTAAGIPAATSAATLFSRLDGARERELRSRRATTALEQLGDASRQRLQTQEQLQEALTDEMVGMAATLKSSTMALEGRLRERDALLDDTDDALQRSLDSARRSRARARQIYRRNRVGFCRTCIALLAVGVMFVGMYMFIRVTYFVGYKS